MVTVVTDDTAAPAHRIVRIELQSTLSPHTDAEQNPMQSQRDASNFDATLLGCAVIRGSSSSVARFSQKQCTLRHATQIHRSPQELRPVGRPLIGGLDRWVIE
jgi:hypothetical protein